MLIGASVSNHGELSHEEPIKTIYRYPDNLPLSASSLAGISPGDNDDDETVQEQLQNYSLLAEFETIHGVLPSGVYLLPDMQKPRTWGGIVFLRQGWYRGGLYQFSIDFPNSYPIVCPSVNFTSTIPPHPLIHPETGELNMNYGFSNWSFLRHSTLHVAAFIKRIFYDKDTFIGEASSNSKPSNSLQGVGWFNREIQQLFISSPSQFLVQVERSAELSFDQATKDTSSHSFISSLFPQVSPSSSLSNGHSLPSRRTSSNSNLEKVTRALQAFSIDSFSRKSREAFLEWLEEYFEGLDVKHQLSPLGSEATDDRISSIAFESEREASDEESLSSTIGEPDNAT